jgi:hypothetical protein
MSTYEYWVCESCAYTETRQALGELPRKCENCGAHWSFMVSFTSLERAEDWSQLVLDGQLVGERPT